MQQSHIAGRVQLRRQRGRWNFWSPSEGPNCRSVLYCLVAVSAQLFWNKPARQSNSKILLERSTGCRISTFTLSPQLMRYPQEVTFRFPASRDHKLVQIVDSALDDATRRSGKWLACRPGCTQCCVGVFAINQLDALRLRRGLRQLAKRSPQKAKAVRERAIASARRLSANFPGNPTTGILNEHDEHAFENFANEEPCPVLNPQTGLCELYESRPMTCRVFGPPIRSDDGLGVCELCFQGATDAEIAACEMKPDSDELEAKLLRQVEDATGRRGSTIIAFCLASSCD